jgi:hypothetical protein
VGAHSTVYQGVFMLRDGWDDTQVHRKKVSYKVEGSAETVRISTVDPHTPRIILQRFDCAESAEVRQRCAHVHAVEDQLGRILKQYSHLDTLWIVKKYHPFLYERQLLRLQLHEIVNYADVLLATVDGFHRRDLFHGQLRLPHFLYNVHARTGTLVGLSHSYYGYNS